MRNPFYIFKKLLEMPFNLNCYSIFSMYNTNYWIVFKYYIWESNYPIRKYYPNFFLIAKRIYTSDNYRNEDFI